jgi:hypothetical protein
LPDEGVARHRECPGREGDGRGESLPPTAADPGSGAVGSVPLQIRRPACLNTDWCAFTILRWGNIQIDSVVLSRSKRCHAATSRFNSKGLRHADRHDVAAVDRAGRPCR